MAILMPSLLVGLIWISIPIVIHWWQRRRARRVRWGAMQFFGLPPHRVVGRRNLAQWVLMAVRMLAVAVMALALSRPRVAAKLVPAAWAEGAPVELAIIIDHSLSTGRLNGGETVFDRSIELADSVLRQLRANDSACVVFAEHGPRLVGPGTIGGGDRETIDRVRTTLREEKPGVTDASIPDAIGLARRVLDGSAGSSGTRGFSPSVGTPGEGWGGGNRSLSSQAPSLTLPRNTGGGDRIARRMGRALN